MSDFPSPLTGRDSQWEAENPNFLVIWPTDKCEGSKWGRGQKYLETHGTSPTQVNTWFTDDSVTSYLLLIGFLAKFYLILTPSHLSVGQIIRKLGFSASHWLSRPIRGLGKTWHAQGHYLWECLLWPGGDLDDSGPQCDHWPYPGVSFSLLKWSKTLSGARLRRILHFSHVFCHTPTLNSCSLAPIGRNDPGPFSTALATKTLTSTFWQISKTLLVARNIINKS